MTMPFAVHKIGHVVVNVADLEKSLAQKDSQSRELIKAKIQVTRQHLEAERSRGRMEMN